MPLRVFAMPDLRYRNGCAMIVFITKIQEPTDNRGACSKWEATAFGHRLNASKPSSQESRG